MSNVSKNEMQEIGNDMPFMQMKLTDTVGAALNNDSDVNRRISGIEKAVKVLNDSENALYSKNEFSSQFADQQASESYRQLISRIVELMNSDFTESEMKAIFNAKGSPFCNGALAIKPRVRLKIIPE